VTNAEQNTILESPRAKSKTPRPSIREEQKLRTRDRLLDAAFEVFSEVGFRAATVDVIMKRAGANRATFYLHFPDKLAIAAGIGRRSATAVAERYRMLDNLVAPDRADVRAWVMEHLEDRRKDRVLVHVINEAITSDARFGQEYIDYFGRVAERVMVKTVARWPAPQRPLVRMKVVCLFIMMQRIEFHWFGQELNFGSGVITVDAITDILWNELFLSAPAAS